MKVSKGVAKRVLGSKILCVVNVYGLVEGLHASRDSPDYMEDDQDYLDFLANSLEHGDGEGPIASLVDAVLLENGRGTRCRHLDDDLKSDNIASLVQDSDDELNEGMLQNCVGYMLYQFINFLKLDRENVDLYQWPQEYLRFENRKSQNSNSQSGSTLLSPYIMSNMTELLDAANSVEETDRPNPAVEFVTDKSLWGVWEACCRYNHSHGDGLFAMVLSKTYDAVIVGPDVRCLRETESIPAEYFTSAHGFMRDVLSTAVSSRNMCVIPKMCHVNCVEDKKNRDIDFMSKERQQELFGGNVEQLKFTNKPFELGRDTKYRDLVPHIPSAIGEGDGAVQVRDEHGSLIVSIVVKPTIGECCDGVCFVHPGQNGDIRVESAFKEELDVNKKLKRGHYTVEKYNSACYYEYRWFLMLSPGMKFCSGGRGRLEQKSFFPLFCLRTHYTSDQNIAYEVFWTLYDSDFHQDFASNENGLDGKLLAVRDVLEKVVDTLQRSKLNESFLTEGCFSVIRVDLFDLQTRYMVNEVHLMPTDGMFMAALEREQIDGIPHSPKVLVTHLAKAYALQYLMSKKWLLLNMKHNSR